MTPKSKLAFLFATILSVAVCAVYAGSMRSPFQFDDKPALAAPGPLGNLDDIEGILLFDKNLPRPLTHLSFSLNLNFNGHDPFGFHLVNLALHLATTLMLFALSRRLFGGDDRAAFLCALVFGVHPALTESVIYIWSRSSLLAGMFMALALWLYTRRSAKPSWAMWALSFASFLIALTGKEIAATLPLLLLAYNYTLGADKRFRADTLPFLVVAAAIPVARYLVIGRVGFNVDGSYIDHLGVQAVVAVKYIVALLWPVNLTVDHAIPASYPLAAIAGAVIIFIALAVTIVRLAPRSIAAFGAAWLVINLLPFVVIPLDDRMVERNLYLPAMGFAMIFADVLKRSRSKVALPFGAAACLALMAGTVSRGRAWSSEESLWRDAARKSPAKARPFDYLAALELDEAPAAKSAWLLDRAIRVDPTFASAHNNMGVVAMRAGDYKRAAYEFAAARSADPGLLEAVVNHAKAMSLNGEVERALATLEKVHAEYPGNVDVAAMLADAYRVNGDAAKAEPLYRKALAARPDDYDTLVGLASILSGNGNAEESLNLLSRALKIDPSRAEAHRALASIYAKRNDWKEAAVEYAKAFVADPKNADIAGELGVARLRSGDPVGAKDAFVKEMTLRPGDPLPLLRLASLAEASGETDEAIKLYNRALMLDRRGRYSADVETILKRLKNPPK